MAASPAEIRDGNIPSADAIAQAIKETYSGPAWHGPSVRSALKGVTPDVAAWRPAPGRNSIHDLVLHLAYARHRLIHRVNARLGRRTPRFPRKMRASWFPEAPRGAEEEQWKEDLRLLEAYQKQVLAVVSDATPAALSERRASQPRSIGMELMGLAFHDAYHAGQIRLLALAAPENAGS